METVLFRAASGLANRLRALVGCRVLADRSGARLCVQWPANGACQARFDELFEPHGWETLDFVDTAEFARIDSANGTLRIDGAPWFTQIWARHGRELGDEASFCREAVAHLRSLRALRAHRERVDEFAAAHDLASRVGVHIRHTDNVSDHAVLARSGADFDPRRVSQLEGFYALLASLHGAGERAFLCTDDPDVERVVRSRFEGIAVRAKDYDARGLERHIRRHYARFGRFRRIVDRLARPARPEPSWRTTPVSDGLIDLLLLGRCREIVGTYYSSFSEVSSIIGGTPLSVLEDSKRVPGRTIRRLQEIAAGAIP